MTFPRGYHGGFSNGFCIGEAANFATVDWFRFGAESCLRYSRLMRPPMLGCEQLLCQEAQSIQREVFGILRTCMAGLVEQVLATAIGIALSATSLVHMHCLGLGLNDCNEISARDLGKPR